MSSGLLTDWGTASAPTTSTLQARFAVAGWGGALPERRVTNDELALRLDTSDAWISTRTGIRERRVGGPGESTGPLAVAAARDALVRARMLPNELDLVVVATTTPEQPMPSTAALVAAELGTPAGAFDLNAACAGFVYGMVVCGSLIETGIARKVLLVGADTLTRNVDPADRGTAVLFGDGAGAVVLVRDGTSEQDGGLLASDLVDDPEGAELLTITAGGSGRPTTVESLAAGEQHLRMDGPELFRRAVRAVSDSVTRTLAAAGCTPADVDLFVPHQANARIIDAVLARVGLAPEQAVQTVDRHGNTSAASVPLALSEIAETGRLRDGSLVLVTGFGAGLTVGTGLLRWRTSWDEQK